MSGRRIAFVGNAPMSAQHAVAIDACEGVVRFNDARGFGGATGSKVTELYLVNRGGAPEEWLEDPLLARRAVIAAAPRVVLPLHPESAYLHVRSMPNDRVHKDDRDHTRGLVQRLRSAERSVHALSPEAHERACQALGLTPDGDDGRRPSTGFVALHHRLGVREPEEHAVLYGFTFEGWDGHPWRAEREWVAARQIEGSVTVVPVGPSAGPRAPYRALKRAIRVV